MSNQLPEEMTAAKVRCRCIRFFGLTVRSLERASLRSLKLRYVR